MFEKPTETTSSINEAKTLLSNLHNKFYNRFPFQMAGKFALAPNRMNRLESSICSSYVDFLSRKMPDNIGVEILTLDDSIHHVLLLRDKNNTSVVCDINTGEMTPDSVGRYCWNPEIDFSDYFNLQSADFYNVNFPQKEKPNEETLIGENILWYTPKAISRAFFLAWQKYKEYKISEDVEDLRIAKNCNQIVINRLSEKHPLVIRALE
jgi:hypothetical protein